MSVSERRACRALDQPRSTQRYRHRSKADEAALLKAIASLPRGVLVLPGLDTSFSAEQHKRIAVADACEPIPAGVDTETDLARVRALLADVSGEG